MKFQVNDGVWVRILDVQAALVRAHVTAATAPFVLDVTDGFMPENAGRYRVAADGVERTDAEAEIALDITGARLRLSRRLHVPSARASRSAWTSSCDGAIARADALFTTSIEPWCAEIF